MKPGRVSQTKVYVYNVSQKTVCHTKQMQIISINQGRLYLCSKTTLELMKDTQLLFHHEHVCQIVHNVKTHYSNDEFTMWIGDITEKQHPLLKSPWE